jgi:uncharacterized membrane protein YjjP (DUF1212 family)
VSPELQRIATDAAGYWERRRPIYNALLAAVVAGYFVAGLPESRQWLDFNLASVLFVLAVIANVLYSAAYVPDVFLQYTEFAATWRRHRWVLFLIGCAMGATMARFFAMDLVRNGV